MSWHEYTKLLQLSFSAKVFLTLIHSSFLIFFLWGGGLTQFVLAYTLIILCIAMLS